MSNIPNRRLPHIVGPDGNIIIPVTMATGIRPHALDGYIGEESGVSYRSNRDARSKS